MTEQQMPARIWVMDDKDHPFGVPTYSKRTPKNPNAPVTVFYRADLAERMAEALLTILANTEEDAIPHISHDGMTAYQSLAKDISDCARSALFAFRSATQDTEARHD
jgi:hypothetical protein